MIPHFSLARLAHTNRHDAQGKDDHDASDSDEQRLGDMQIPRGNRSRSARAVPSGGYSHMAYIKVYATCRLRRIWLSESAESSSGRPWEFQLYGTE